MVTIADSPIRSANIQTPKVLTNCRIVPVAASLTRVMANRNSRAST